MTKRYKTLVKLWVANDEQLISATRTFLEEGMGAALGVLSETTAYAERLSTASSELLENARKFSPPQSLIGIEIGTNPKSLRLRIVNELAESPQEVLNCVKRQIKTIWAEADAKEAFRRRVKDSLSVPGSKSMLGYAKIRMETGAQIRARLTNLQKLEIAVWFWKTPEPPFVDSP